MKLLENARLDSISSALSIDTGVCRISGRYVDRVHVTIATNVWYMVMCVCYVCNFIFHCSLQISTLSVKRFISFC